MSAKRSTVIKITPQMSVRKVVLEEPLYESLNQIFDGLFEIVRPKNSLPQPFVMIIDESGRLKGLPANPLASLWYKTYLHGVPIVGDVLIMKEECGDDGPDIFGLSEEEMVTVFQFVLRELRQYEK